MESPRILLIEDQDATRLALVELLQHEGYSVSVAARGEDAVAAFSEHRPDVILSDYRFPDGTLADFIDRMPGPPLVLVSGAAELHDNGGFEFRHPFQHSARVAHYLPKPVDFEQLLQALKEVCSSTD